MLISLKWFYNYSKQIEYIKNTEFSNSVFFVLTDINLNMNKNIKKHNNCKIGHKKGIKKNIKTRN